MAGYNRVILVGNLTRDPELRQLQSGTTVCRLNIATNRSYKDRQSGNLVQDVCFIDVDVWGSQADACKQYLQKGRPVLVEGRLKLDSWKDAEGQNRSKHSVVASVVQFLSSPASADQAQQNAEAASMVSEEEFEAPVAAPKARKSDAAKKLAEAPFEDELPF